MAEINKLSVGQALDHLRHPDAQSKQTRLDEKTDALDLPTWAQVLAAAPRVYGRDVEIFGQQEPADCLYKVVSGAVRTFSVLRDGRRHIAGFHLAGDFFGFEANSRHVLSAAAICNSKILVIKHSVLAILAEHDMDIARRVRGMMGGELGRAQIHLTNLIMTSCERVAEFLLEMADRSPETNEIELPMSRREIADHLGMTVETVSRTFAKFEAIKAIARSDARHVKLRSRAALERISPRVKRQNQLGARRYPKAAIGT